MADQGVDRGPVFLQGFDRNAVHAVRRHQFDEAIQPLDMVLEPQRSDGNCGIAAARPLFGLMQAADSPQNRLEVAAEIDLLIIFLGACRL